MSLGWFFLGAMIAAYGVANLLQSKAIARTTVHHTFDPGLLLNPGCHDRAEAWIHRQSEWPNQFRSKILQIEDDGGPPPTTGVDEPIE